MFPNGVMPGLLGSSGGNGSYGSVGTSAGLLPNLTSPIMQQQMYQRMGNPLPGGLSPPGAQGMMSFGTAGPNANANPMSNSNIAASLARGG